MSPTHPGRGPAERPVAHRFGAHLSIAGGMHRAIEAARSLGFDTVQVFVKNQRQWRAAPLRRGELDRWFELLASPGFGPPVAHASYLINLASADRRLWNRSVAALADELRRCDALSIPALVVHPGAAGAQPTEAAVARVAAALDRVLGARPAIRAMPLLEATAGQGSSLGRCPEELGQIIARVGEPQRVGVCVDTCHVFAAGYDIRDARAYGALIDELAACVGLERIRCWHVNDSQRELGSRVDRHEHIGRGRIGAAGFRNLLRDARFAGTPMILETPKGSDASGRDWDAVNLTRLRRLSAGARRAAGVGDPLRPRGRRLSGTARA